MRHLDLFSGIGGFALAAQWMGWQTVAFCEREKYARRVLEQHWPGVPIIDDITKWSSERIGCDIITGGFPCQPFSSAGLKRGKEDDRYLWPAMLSVIERERPTWVVGENVFGIIKMALDQVLSDLEAIGYATRAFIVPACAVDAHHRRDRVWVIAMDDTNSSGWREKRKEMEGGQAKLSEFASVKSNLLADSKGKRWEGMPQKSLYGKQDILRQFGRSCEDQPNRWPAEPPVGRVAHGIPNRLAKLRGLGNAIVPQVAYEIFNHLEAFSQSNQDYALRKPGGRAAELAAHNLDKS